LIVVGDLPRRLHQFARRATWSMLHVFNYKRAVPEKIGSI